ncbi:hypothetical protein EW146_g4783 [Bondarzewia mesenterica]|uniref:Uncharacterized protein n=1 Tax=Bondarzewia mesenterica TaxID=1095465 RepID=A0A4S4LTI8_9AGAM|nr:hypothetical protein EW146_g4783 [Bondarzewia mesenterica]
MDDQEPAIMYQPVSPIFDIPEFPSLRRVKPLPKRRRTSADTSNGTPHDKSAGGLLPSILPHLPGPDATAEELIVHAEELSAQMALQSYYMPIFGGVQGFMKGESGVLDHDGTPAINFGVDFGSGGRDDEQGDGDYVDHLPQPGNTKKRKVPANQFGSRGEHDVMDGQSGGEEEQMDRGIPVGVRQDEETFDLLRPSSPGGGDVKPRRRKMLPATLVGLQHKEMLKHRKRQLAAVLGALSHGDTLALDQALSANYPLLNPTASKAFIGDWNALDPRPRLLRRASHVARLRARAKFPISPETAERVAFPECNFSFVCHSTTSDRLVATREEVAVLHARFEAELARQAAKAEEAAKQAASAAPTNASKQTDRARQKARTGPPKPIVNSLLPDQTFGVTKSRGKKKKRSALANASNPHHLRNYVPSRLPNQGQINSAQAQANAQNFVSSLPLRFLSAEIPSRRRKHDRPSTPMSQLVNPADEWICPFCEYQLFYGSEQGYRRALRDRKKILKRRRRARERAAAAASGNSAPFDKAPKDEVDAVFEPEFSAPADVPTKQTRARGDREKEGDRGDHVQGGGR